MSIGAILYGAAHPLHVCPFAFGRTFVTAWAAEADPALPTIFRHNPPGGRLSSSQRRIFLEQFLYDL